MTEKNAEPAAPLDYKEHRIVLTSRQQADGTWTCEYIVSEPGNPSTGCRAGSLAGSFPSREAAELTAVQKAKALIDSAHVEKGK